jgi:hypothetical protein
MRPTPQNLLAFLAAGAVFGLSLSQLATGFGYAFPVSPWSMVLMLPLIGAATYLASWPIYRYRKRLEQHPEGPRPARPNPFYAFRVLIVSRAVALTGALFAGWHLGSLIWLLSFSVAPTALVLPMLFGLIGSVAMLGGGILGEFNCRAPKDPGEGAE